MDSNNKQQADSLTNNKGDKVKIDKNIADKIKRNDLKKQGMVKEGKTILK